VRSETIRSDVALVGDGLDLRKRSVDQVFALMRETYARVRDAKDARSTVPLMEFLYSNISRTLSRIENSGLACRKGCFSCCTSWVAASAPEILYLLNSVRDRAQVKARVSEATELTDGRTQSERMKMQSPCPLLIEGACGVYEFRPLVCRTQVSYDASSCERFYTQFTGRNPAISEIYVVVRNVYALALAGALRHAGLPPYFYEFNAALEKLMERTDCEQAWLAGEDILAKTPRDQGADMFEDSWNLKIYDEAFA